MFITSLFGGLLTSEVVYPGDKPRMGVAGAMGSSTVYIGEIKNCPYFKLEGFQHFLKISEKFTML